MTLASDLNELSSFLADDDVVLASLSQSVDCIAICASQVLLQAEILFHLLEQRPGLTRTLVIVGGVGHSTQALYNAVASHPKYWTIARSIIDLPEARVLEQLLTTFFDVNRIKSQGCQILIEDLSTNCGSNASETKKLLDRHNVTAPREIVLVQDPTMLLRTCASFVKAYECAAHPLVLGSPLFVPRVEDRPDGFVFATPPADTPGVWSEQRFTDLLLGEIDRLRDDENGYGPKGKGFIGHVDIPQHIEAAFQRVSNSRLSSSRLRA